MLRYFGLSLCLCATLVLPIQAESPPPPSPGLVTQQSAYGVSQTADKLEALLKAKGLRVFARVDHGSNAKSVNKNIAPSILLIFGNPKIGSDFMATNPQAAIDLPQKILIWQAADNLVLVGYNDPQYFAKRHALDENMPQLQKVAQVLMGLVQEVTKK